MGGSLVARAGVQPATFALGVRCSMQLSYRATCYQCIAGAGLKPFRFVLTHETETVA